jgi:hypothetical protein
MSGILMSWKFRSVASSRGKGEEAINLRGLFRMIRTVGASMLFALAIALPAAAQGEAQFSA